jgi:hypothetical protein
VGIGEFFVPLFHTAGSLSGVFMQDEQQWTSSYYMWECCPWRWPPSPSGGREEDERFAGCFGAGGRSAGVGRRRVVLNILKRAVPLLGFIRFPVKFIILTMFCLALLAGAGAAWLQTQPPEVVRRSLFRAGGDDRPGGLADFGGGVLVSFSRSIRGAPSGPTPWAAWRFWRRDWPC